MPKSQPTCTSILNLMYCAVTWSNVAINATAGPLTNVELALHTATLTPATDSQEENETAYTNKARVAVARSAVGWTVASGTAENAALAAFPKCGASGSTVTYLSTGTDHTGAGHVWHYGEMNSPLAVALNITPQFPAGNIVIQEV